MSLKVGDIIENSMWLTGEETEELKERYKIEITETIDDLCAREGFEHGPITMSEKHPMDHDVPEVPDHIEGPKVRLLYLEATVVKLLLTDGEGLFVDNLEPKDLLLLRKITRKAIFEKSGLVLADEECDEIIEELGEDAALAAMRKNSLRVVH